MNKLILTIIGIVSSTTVGWAQTYPQIGEVLNMSNHHELVNGGWEVISVQEPGLGEGSPKIVTVQKGEAVGELIYWNGTDFDEFNFGTHYLGNSSGLSFGEEASWGGSINNGGGSITIFDEDLNETSLDFPEGYIQYSGGYYGAGAAAAAAAAAAASASITVIAEQAAELNIGLIFTNGQWGPSQQ
jgi:hypothetical protein